jgi:hypothetical protein
VYLTKSVTQNPSSFGGWAGSSRPVFGSGRNRSLCGEINVDRPCRYCCVTQYYFCPCETAKSAGECTVGREHEEEVPSPRPIDDDERSRLRLVATLLLLLLRYPTRNAPLALTRAHTTSTPHITSPHLTSLLFFCEICMTNKATKYLLNICFGSIGN